MKKDLKVNINEYILLQLFYMLEFYNFDDIIQNEIEKFRNLLEDKIYGNFFKNCGDILSDEFILSFQFEEK